VEGYPPEGKIPMIDLMDEAPGLQLFKTADEVDEYLQRERESWDR
jgi:alpha-D-ribose 1-methylphosphonate 5-triphosphate diphosphatase PhnM